MDILTGIGGKVTAMGGNVINLVNNNIIQNTLEFINPRDYFIQYIKNYISSVLLDDMPNPKTLNEKLKDNVHYSIAQYILTPFERSRHLMQTQHIIPNIKSPYVGALDCFFKVLRETGFRSLFRGSMSGMLYSLYTFNFTDYRQKSLITSYKEDKSDHNTVNTIGYLLILDFLNTSILHPIELIWTRRSCDTRSKVTHNTCITEVHYLLTQKGGASLFTGYSYSLAAIMINYAIFTPYVLYNSFKFEDVLDIYIDLTLAMIGLEFLLHPFDTIKRRRIVQCHENVESIKYTNFMQTIRLIYKEEHLVGLYKGCLQRLILNLSRRFFFYISYNYTI